MRKPRVYFAIGLILAVASLSAACGPSPTEPQAPPQPVATPTASAVDTPKPTLPPATVAPAGPAAGQTLPPTPSATVSPSASTQEDQEAAVQTLLDYFDAINQQNYGMAYGYWAGNGAASGQTPQEFTHGFADTVRVSVLLGTVDSTGMGTTRRVSVAADLMSVVNLPDHTQRVQHYQGTYALQPSGASGWEIASAEVAEVAAGPLPPPDVADPVTLLRSYFDAISRRQFARAYTYWNQLGQASQQDFARFERGYAATLRVTVEVGTPREGGAAGSIYAEVPVSIQAAQSDGTVRVFSGTYTARRLNVPPFDQLGWRIEGANVRPGPAPASTQAAWNRPMSYLSPAAASTSVEDEDRVWTEAGRYGPDPDRTVAGRSRLLEQSASDRRGRGEAKAR